MESRQDSTLREFVVVVRAHSQVAVRSDDEPLVLDRFPNVAGGEPVRVSVSTRYEEQTFGIPAHRELLIEVRGGSASVETAVAELGATGSSLVPALSFATNAYIGETVPYVAYEVTPDTSERAFIQEFHPDYPDEYTTLPLSARALRGNATAQFIHAVARHKEGQRIRRAMDQYWLALSHWQPHKKALSLAHLFMAAEALAVAALRNQQTARGLSADELAKMWSVKETPRGGFRPGDVQAAARRELVFHGDKDCHRQAKRASDDFEHGLTDLSAVEATAKDVRDLTASHVRRAIFELSGSPETAVDVLLKPPLDQPQEAWGPVGVLRGRIMGEGDGQLRGDGDAHPHYLWRRTVDAKLDADGRDNVTFSERLTASIGGGYQFANDRFEVRGSRQPGVDYTGIQFEP